MGVDIEVIDADRSDEWARAVDRSDQTTIFHQSAALEELAAASGTTLYRLMGFTGQEPVGVFPLFALSKGPVTGVFSPPPNLWVPTLGPAYLNMAKLKRRKRDRRRRRFVDGVFDWLDRELGARYVRVRTSHGIADARPFKWNDCTVTPEYTYATDLRDGESAVRDRFSSDARSNIRTGEDNADQFTITEAGRDAAITIMERVTDRYEEQGEPFPVPTEFPARLYEALPAGQIRPYVFRVEDSFVGGILAYDDGDRVARWYGGVTPAIDVDLPVNDILDWRVMCDAIERGRSTYDLVGAGDPRLNQYKAKFGPELERFYAIERSSAGMNVLMRAYRRFASGT